MTVPVAPRVDGIACFGPFGFGSYQISHQNRGVEANFPTLWPGPLKGNWDTPEHIQSKAKGQLLRDSKQKAQRAGFCRVLGVGPPSAPKKLEVGCLALDRHHASTITSPMDSLETSITFARSPVLGATCLGNTRQLSIQAAAVCTLLHASLDPFPGDSNQTPHASLTFFFYPIARPHCRSSARDTLDVNEMSKLTFGQPPKNSLLFFSLRKWVSLCILGLRSPGFWIQLLGIGALFG